MELEKQIILLMVLGIFAIIFLESVALMNGINGTIFGLSMAGIGGIIVQAGNMIRAKYKARTKKFEIAMSHNNHHNSDKPPMNYNNHMQGWKK